MNVLRRMFLGFFLEFLRRDDPPKTVAAPSSGTTGFLAVGRSSVETMERQRARFERSEPNSENLAAFQNCFSVA